MENGITRTVNCSHR